jgi:hypothetical protein
MSDTEPPLHKNHPDSPAPSTTPYGHAEVGFDKSEVSVFGVNMVLIAIAIVFAGAVLVGGAILAIRKAPQREVSTSNSYSLPVEPKPAQPRLDPLDFETANVPNVFAAQLERERELQRYGNTTEEGFVHIPIDIAMRIAPLSKIMHNGQGKPPDKAFGLVGGGEANSGRFYSEAPQWLQPPK